MLNWYLDKEQLEKLEEKNGLQTALMSPFSPEYNTNTQKSNLYIICKITFISNELDSV